MGELDLDINQLLLEVERLRQENAALISCHRYVLRRTKQEPSEAELDIVRDLVGPCPDDWF